MNTNTRPQTKALRHLASTILVLAAGSPVLAPQATGPTEEQDLIVAFDGPPQVEVVCAIGGRVRGEFPLIRALAVRAPCGAAARLRDNPQVRYVEVDGRSTGRGNDRSTDAGALAPAMPPPGLPHPQVTPYGVARVGAPAAWATSRGAGVRVMVLDIGVGPNTDLAIAGGINFVNLAGDSNYADTDGHGTRVSGVIAALDNNVGYVGVAPDCELYSVRIRESTVYQPSWIVAGIEWSVANGAHVINMSLGTQTDSQAVADALAAARDAGVTLIGSAGNGGQGGAPVNFPAAHPGVLGVGATDAQDHLASFSSSGYWLDLAAPGANITTLAPNDQTAVGNGTSMSAPHVAGVAALVWGAVLADPELSLLPRSAQGAVVQQALLRTADDWTVAPGSPGWDQYTGLGIVNAVAAVDLPQALTNDIAVTAFNGPTSGAPNEVVSFEVAITNLGAVTEQPVQVSLIQDPNGSPIVLIAPPILALGPGDTTTVSFTATLPDNPLGTELFTARVDTTSTDQDPSNNSADLVVSIGPAQPTADVLVSYQVVGKKLRVTLDVSSGGNPLVGASVSYALRLDGSVVANGTATTDSTGKASFTRNRPSAGTYTTDVTGVIGAGPTVYLVTVSDPGHVL